MTAPAAAAPGAADPVRTKVVATLGPASRSDEGIRGLIDAAVDVFRLNMAHGTPDEHAAALAAIRRIADEAGRPIGVLVDLAGPKIRLGELPGGAVECAEGSLIRFVSGTSSTRPDEFVTTYPQLVDELSKGDSVMLADGTISLLVEERSADAAVCRVVQGGTVRSRQGVNLPGVRLSVAALSPADWQHAEWAAGAGADFVSLSFVRTAVEVRLLKELLRTRGSVARVIAKIEKLEALDDLEAIVDAADGVMVARGDLGVEIDVATMPMMQKRIIRTCQRYQKPVIVATQMLDSMHKSRRPTRAEATDVANAILDGADACMLSGETAIGDHPHLAVKMMRRIARATEELYLDDRKRVIEQGLAAVPGVIGEIVPPPEKLVDGLHPITQAVVDGAGRIAAQLGARLVVVATRTGLSALARSKRRGGVPTLGVSDNLASLRQMALYWGVTPLAIEGDDVGAIVSQVTAWGRAAGRLSPGDRIVLVSSSGFARSGHDMAVVHEV
ncbi:MAG: pyruvate kinase [Planctomycetes bacterium]|nr:pyruvate kinase [Planctomycetota bacterium]MBM4058064.1 pyruvate kinase [Planctomycetota bacterium]